MKTRILLILGLMFFVSTAKAQLGMGDVLGMLVNGIKPSAFNSEWKDSKGDFISKLSGINATDYIQYASMAGQLAGFLKSTSFMPDWANKKDGILDQLQKAGSIADVASGVQGMTNLLSSKSLTSGFKKNKKTFNTALDVLKMIK